MKRILITGGSDGLGKSFAEVLKAAGHAVVILGRDEAKTKRVAAELNCEYVVADIRDAKAVAAAVKQAGAVDVLINNAGTWIQDALDTNDDDKIREVIEVNVLGTIYATKAVVPGMKQRGNGRIINVISQAGFYAKGERAPYTASKWAVTGFTKSMQAELKPFKISVTGLYPGALDTDMFVKTGYKKRENALDTNEAAKSVAYICSLPDYIDIPELGIQSLNY